MNVLLPLALLAILVVSLILQHKKPVASSPGPLIWCCLACFAASAAYALFRLSPPDEVASLMIAAAIGLAGSIVATHLELFDAHVSALIALGAAVPACVPAFDSGTPNDALLTASFASAIGALLFPSRSASMASFVASLACITAVLGADTNFSFVYPTSGVVLFGAIALVALCGLALKRLVSSVERIWPVIACIVVAAIAYAASIKYLMLGAGWISVCAAPAVALVVYWLIESAEEGEAFPALVSALLWLGLGTAAFGLSKAFGLSLATLLAVGVLAILGSERALISTGPILAIVLVQLFRVLHPDAVRSVDVGQHYVLIGFAVGLVIPLLPSEWLAKELPASRKPLGALTWSIALCAAPLAIGIYLAPKGLVGFVAGLAFSGLIAAMRKSQLLVIALGAGAACLSILEYDWMGELTDLARADKIHWVLYSAIAAAVVAAALSAISFNSGKKLAEAA